VIAARVGFGTAANLRAQFVQQFGTSPSSYRRTFTRGLSAKITFTDVGAG
jgi:transcriptional regulator GlxA family with amidase domain